MNGFGVRVTAAGAVAFIFNYRTRGGRKRRITIGYTRPSASKPPGRTPRACHVVNKGGDPLADRKAVREAPTFKDLADAYIEEHLPKKRGRQRRTKSDHR